ncbi:MAG: hypothetical protein GF355_00970 [Candidatus Eisenbacteria bacterium]|nr:hypothetical protein [Candidatus Eisenbacteria bacterium]
MQPTISQNQGSHARSITPAGRHPQPSRRTRPDRRRRRTPAFSRYTLRGRRRAARRTEEAVGLYVDRLAPGVAWAIVLIFLFHCLDAFLTLAHIERGGSEINPFMAFLIDAAPATFVAVKLGLAAAGLFILGLHQNFPHVRKGIGVLFVVFFGVVLYHFFLIAHALAF